MYFLTYVLTSKASVFLEKCSILTRVSYNVNLNVIVIVSNTETKTLWSVKKYGPTMHCK